MGKLFSILKRFGHFIVSQRGKTSLGQPPTRKEESRTAQEQQEAFHVQERVGYS